MFGLYLRSALLTLWSAKLRSVLTMLGIVIGVTLLLSLVSLGQGAKRQIIGQINTLGTDLVYVVSAKKYVLSNFEAATLSKTDVDTVRNTNGIAGVSPVRYLSGSLTSLGKSTEPNLIVATTSNYKNVRGVDIDNGDFFSQKDDDQANDVAVIGSVTAKLLFADSNPVGQNVTFNSRNYKVVGVLKPANPDSELTIGGGFDNILYLPLNAIDYVATNKNQPLSVIVGKVKPEVSTTKMKQILHDEIQNNHGDNENFSVIAHDDLLHTSTFVVDTLSALILIITSASLLVGGIGIMNIMLVSVAERTKEIGIRKSMGATPRDILLQFLVESVLLSFVGGTIGIGLSFALTRLAANLFSITPVFSTGLIMLGFGVSVGIGILFGISPAIRAARKNPIDALHFE